MSRRPTFLVIGFCFTAATASVFAATASAQSAREHFSRGAAAYQQGDYEAAIAEWKQAYKLDPKPRLQYNLSQAYERLGQLQLAVEALEVFTDAAEDDDANMADARARLAALRERLANTAILIAGGVEGATILIDGEDWGRTPRRDPVRVSPGTHEVVVQKSGYTTFRASAVVVGGKQVDMQVEMKPVGEEDVSRSDAGEEQETRPIGATIWPWVLIGGGGAAVVGGAVLGISALSKADDAESSDSSEADTARGLALGADVLIGLGVVAAGTGVALLLLFPEEDEQGPASQALRVAPSLAKGRVGVQAWGRF